MTAWEDSYWQKYHARLDRRSEAVADDLATFHAGRRGPFDGSVKEFFGAKAVEWTAEQLTQIIIHARELVYEHGIMTGINASGLYLTPGDERTRAQDARIAKELTKP